jgi:hypothetical protein
VVYEQHPISAVYPPRVDMRRAWDDQAIGWVGLVRCGLDRCPLCE